MNSVIIAYMLQGKPQVLECVTTDPLSFDSLEAAATWSKDNSTMALEAADRVWAIDLDTGEVEEL